ncbi:type VI secretion system Vgr family protein [Polyangium aurulentum]|uniref:type VI secretion system Vgr family protein n=1 Tax=Polyangium aurulentum TaxID=2567896 RepID=UPI00146EA7E2|nr:type VI secretion system tip protein TssI/VgrG [Polyangium aurulentum]UQA60661.1 type VI secretion system tip protein VgrG [Polyangium aurulentum]
MANVELSFESGETSLSVRRFDVREALSTSFRAMIVAMSADDDLDLDALVGRAASLAIEGAGRGARRVLRGVCLSAEQVQAEEAGLSTYEIEIGPSLALLEHRSRYRVFQHRSVPEIVEAILAEWGIVAQLAIDRARYPRLEYRVQFGESDLAFISRLLEEAGVSFTFPTESAADAPDVLLEDASHRSEPSIFAQHVEHALGDARTPHVTRVRVGRKLRTGRVVVRDQHFRLRADAKLFGDVAAKNAERFERYEYAHGASVAELSAIPGGETPVADAHGAARPDAKRLERLAQQVLERERVRGREVSFETNLDDLRPGMCVSIKGHPREELRRGNLLVTELRTTGTTNTKVWKIEARALFTDVPFRPSLATPKPRAQGVQTATVVGPQGEDIHTDEFGRVLVQFAWDRENDFNEKSSCWLRVSQGWAGGAHSAFTLPRVGDEVVVGFFDGDPDQPVVIGRLHNATSPVPYRLPSAKTVSTWRSASVPATGGFNEIKFDDAAGSELVSVQAERDMKTLIKNTDTIKVGASRRTQVGTTDDTQAGERHSITIAAHDAAESSPVTRIETTPSKIVLTTGQARLVLEGPNITFDAPGSFVVKAAGLVRVESSGGDVIVQGGPMVRINPRGAGEHPDAPGGAIPFDLPDGEGAEAFDDLMTNVAMRAWFDPKNPTYLDQATAPGGELDPTPRGNADDELRAFKYAVAGRAIGLPEGVLLRRAGRLNLSVNGPAAGKGAPGNGVFGGEAPYGNSERQAAAMQKGFAFYDKQYAEPEAEG